MEVRANLSDIVLFMVMVLMEGGTIGLTIMAKTAITNGMSPFVFIVYTNVLGCLVLLPYSFVFHNDRTEESMFQLPLILRVFFLGVMGLTIPQNVAYLGLSYSSPILVCAMGLLLPTFSFILTVILRRTTLVWRSTSLQVKLIGVLISVIGAVTVNIYKGPAVGNSASSYYLQTLPRQQLLVFASTTTEHWALGGILLGASTMSVSVWNILQMETVKKYPQLPVMKIVSLYSLIGTILCVIVSLVTERDISAWKLKLDMELLLIISTALFGSVIKARVHIWCMQTKGPLYVPMFKPFGILFATIFGVSFFATTIHYGSIIATLVVGIGYYSLMYGQIKEDEDRGDEKVDSSGMKVPLLQEDVEV